MPKKEQEMKEEFGWFIKKHGEPPDPNKVNRGLPKSLIVPEDQSIIEFAVKVAIPGVVVEGRLDRGRWDSALNFLSVKNINEKEYAETENVLRKIVKAKGMEPENFYHKQLIHRWRGEVHQLWRRNNEPKMDEIEDWLRG